MSFVLLVSMLASNKDPWVFCFFNCCFACFTTETNTWDNRSIIEIELGSSYINYWDNKKVKIEDIMLSTDFYTLKKITLKKLLAESTWFSAICMHPPGVPPTCSISCSPPTCSPVILTSDHWSRWVGWHRWLGWSSWLGWVCRLRWVCRPGWLNHSTIRGTQPTGETTVSRHVIL